MQDSHGPGESGPSMETLAWLADAGVREGRAPEASPKARYRLKREIGRGGMGRIFEADDAQFGRTVAIKELHEGRDSDEARRRFSLEALVTANLEHPGVVPVFERGILDGKPFYAMRRVQGRPLDAVLAERHTLEERLGLLSVVVQVAHTLGYAHDHGVVHRDVKPANVMVGRHGEAVLLDWGIAKVSGAGADAIGISASDVGSEHTVDGAVLGTPAYMAPEQARGELAAVDARTDVFALGALLYRTLSGRPPFAGSTVAALVSAASDARFTPLPEIAPRVPAPLVAIVDKAMALRPDDRYATAGELALALEAFLAGAVLQRPGRWLGWAVGGLVAVSLGAFLAALAALMRVSSSLAEQGAASYGALCFMGVSSVLAVVEWRTARRYRLAPVILAFGIATVLLGIANAVGGLSVAIATAQRMPVPPPPTFVLEAFYEVGGSVILGCLLGALQVILWALCARLGSRPAGGSRPASARRSPPAPPASRTASAPLSGSRSDHSLRRRTASSAS